MATKERMNIHKALSELKIIDDRISKEIGRCRFVGMTKKVSQMIGSDTVKKFCDDEKAQYDKVCALIKRRNAIKRAVVLSNAVTKVIVGGAEYTVAEAIDMKNHGMDGKKLLRDSAAFAIRKLEQTYEMTVAQNERQADDQVRAVCAGKDSKSEEAASVRKSYLEMVAVEKVDPLGAKKIVADLEDEIAAFSADVDAALSVSNANTEIEIEY